MSNKILIVFLIIATLLVIVFISLQLNQKSIDAQKDIFAQAEIVLKYGDGEEIINFDDIKLSGEEEFEAILDTSSTNPSKHKYTGVQLKNLLKSKDIILNNNTVIISAVDGYSVAYSAEEILTDKNIFIAYKEDGRYLKNKKEGGRGPYESIVVSDQFSYRRCKWITKIEVK
jgi:hypothetical protein